MTSTESATGTTIPDDDPTRELVVVSPDDPGVTHVGLVGDTYTVIVSGRQTAGKYCLIDMLIPPGGGPGPHRHDFEEMFTLLEGEADFTFRGQVSTVRAGQTVNIPANAPHFFHNSSNAPVRLLCMCTPAGQEDFFAKVGDEVPQRTSPAPKLTGQALEDKLALFAQEAPNYSTEVLMP